VSNTTGHFTELVSNVGINKTKMKVSVTPLSVRKTKSSGGSGNTEVMVHP